MKIRHFIFIIVPFLFISCNNGSLAYDDTAINQKISELEEKVKGKDDEQDKKIEELEKRIAALEKLVEQFSTFRTEIDTLQSVIDNIVSLEEYNELKASFTNLTQSVTDNYTQFQTNLLNTFNQQEEELNTLLTSINADITAIKDNYAKTSDFNTVKNDLETLTGKVTALQNAKHAEYKNGLVLFYNDNSTLFYAITTNGEYTATFCLDAPLKKNNTYSNDHFCTLVTFGGYYQGSLNIQFTDSKATLSWTENYCKPNVSRPASSKTFDFDYVRLYNHDTSIMETLMFRDLDIYSQENQTRCSYYGFVDFSISDRIYFSDIVSKRLPELCGEYIQILADLN